MLPVDGPAPSRSQASYRIWGNGRHHFSKELKVQILVLEDLTEKNTQAIKSLVNHFLQFNLDVFERSKDMFCINVLNIGNLHFKQNLIS